MISIISNFAKHKSCMNSVIKICKYYIYFKQSYKINLNKNKLCYKFAHNNIITIISCILSVKLIKIKFTLTLLVCATELRTILLLG